MNIGRNIGIFTSPTSWLSTLNWIYFQIWLSAVNALYSIWLAVFFSFSFFRIPNICFFFFKLLLALIATSFLNVNENFLWFFLCSVSSKLNKNQLWSMSAFDWIHGKYSNFEQRLISDHGRKLLRTGKRKKIQQKTENHSVPENGLFYIQSLKVDPPTIPTDPFYQ